MKRLNFIVMLSATSALTLGMTGCNKNEAESAGGIGPGQPAVMKLTVFAPRTPQTYAADDLNATDAEIEMKTVNVLIYAETPMPGVYILEKNVSLVKEDFENTPTAPGTYTLKDDSSIATTTGNKKLYVVMNYPGALPAAKTPVTDLPHLICSLSTVTDLSSPTNGFAMSSAEEKAVALVVETSPGVTPAPNKVTVAVKRMVAKITVQENIPRTEGGIISQGGILTSLQFAVGHANRSVYTFQKRVGTAPGIVVQDPNWSSHVAGDFFVISDYTLASTEYLPIDTAETATLSLKTAYAPENTAAAYNVDGDNLTYISVRAQYQPKFFCDDTGASLGPNTDPPKSFWVVTNIDGNIFYFDNRTDADTYHDNTAGSRISAEYVSGLCYFRVYINRNGVADGNIAGSVAAKFDVLRNNYYKVTVNDIKAPGSATDEGKVTEETSLMVNVEVQPWFLVEDDYGL